MQVIVHRGEWKAAVMLQVAYTHTSSQQTTQKRQRLLAHLSAQNCEECSHEPHCTTHRHTQLGRFESTTVVTHYGQSRVLLPYVCVPRWVPWVDTAG